MNRDLTQVTWQDRLELFIRYRYNSSYKDFCAAAGYTVRTLKKYLNYEQAPYIDFLLKVSLQIPELDIYWVATGVPNGLKEKYAFEDAFNERLERVEKKLKKVLKAVEKISQDNQTN